MSYLNMDLSDAKVGLGFDLVPSGDYTALVIDSELTRSKNDNMMLNLTWLIIEGDLAERMVFDRIMLSGSDKAIAFGKNRLKTLADAIGHPNPNRVDDSSELHGLPCLITVAIKKGDGDYSDSNTVKNYRALTNLNHQQPTVAVSPNTPSAQSAAPPKSQNAPPARMASPPPPNQKPQTPFDPPSENEVPM